MKVDILGVKIDNVNFKEAIEKIDGFIKENKFHLIVTVNPEFVMLAQKDEEFKKILNSADLVVPDGIGIILASKILGQPLKERVTGVDLSWALAKLAEDKGYSMFFLGGQEGVAQKTAERLKLIHPRLNIVGAEAGPTLDKEGNEVSSIKYQVSSIQADILLVAFGSPKQEKFIAKNMDKLNCRIAMGVGGTFDFISGKIPRAPIWMQKLGLEWLYRLICQPSRWRRMFALPKFIYLILKKRINLNDD